MYVLMQWSQLVYSLLYLSNISYILYFISDVKMSGLSLKLKLFVSNFPYHKCTHRFMDVTHSLPHKQQYVNSVRVFLSVWQLTEAVGESINERGN